jgi:hypothetical protein
MNCLSIENPEIVSIRRLWCCVGFINKLTCTNKSRPRQKNLEGCAYPVCRETNAAFWPSPSEVYMHAYAATHTYHTNTAHLGITQREVGGGAWKHASGTARTGDTCHMK